MRNVQIEADLGFVNKVIDELKKENFSLKLKIHFLNERLNQLAPDQIDVALKENIELKVEFHTLRHELKRYKKMLLEVQSAMETLQSEKENGGGGGAGRVRELEALLRKARDEARDHLEAREQLERELSDQDRELQALRDQIAKGNGGEDDVSLLLDFD